MRLTSITPHAIAHALGARLRTARHASRRARLYRELSRLPAHIPRDIGVVSDQDQFVNFSD